MIYVSYMVLGRWLRLPCDLPHDDGVLVMESALL